MRSKLFSGNVGVLNLDAWGVRRSRVPVGFHGESVWFWVKLLVFGGSEVLEVETATVRSAMGTRCLGGLILWCRTPAYAITVDKLRILVAGRRVLQ
ncbi:hypothetical protein Droror1_Dr00001111 [Drosera rotundifolia]